MTVTVFSRKPGAYTISTEALIGYLNLDVKIEYLVAGEPCPEFEKLFAPNNRFAPSLHDTSNNLVLNQAVAVNRYLLSLAKDDKGLLGSKPTDKYDILMWSNRVDGDIFKYVIDCVRPKFQGKILTQKDTDAIIAAGPARGFDILEAHLKNHTYLVGETLTLADIEAAGLLYLPLSFFVNAKWQKEHSGICRWAKTILNDKAFEKMFGGSFKIPANGASDVFYAAQPAASQQKSAGGAAGGGAAGAAAAPANNGKSLKHPLVALGASSIPIDELKRTYSNKETRQEALPWFWNTFYNDEEWSIWKVDYKYNDELTLTFMSNNLIGGFFNRLSGSIKYIFGAAVVFGENNNNGIRGAFVIRGKDFKPVFDVAPDWESYEFTRLDAKNPKDRAELEDLWAWDKPIVYNGEEREISDGKVLK